MHASVHVSLSLLACACVFSLLPALVRQDLEPDSHRNASTEKRKHGPGSMCVSKDIYINVTILDMLMYTSVYTFFYSYIPF